jgi:ABC-type transport system substrate-binding protein
MRTKWLLIALPLLILGVLLQSAFWVPTYASQAKGNPRRLVTFLRASIGDAKHLNPMISSDAGASDVMDGNIFEALVDADENLKLIPKLAERWEITENAYLAVLPERRLPHGGSATGAELLRVIEAARRGAGLGGVEASILGIELVPGETRAATETVLAKNAKGKDEPIDVEMTIDVPERVRFALSKVEPELFKKLEPVLGAAYFANYPFEQRFKLKKPELMPQLRAKLPELLGIGEHNPIISFFLRKGIRWHDGQPLTAEDVKFTYQAIVDPKNASPRASSFDPIKAVEIPDPLTARVIYKQLYAPAIIDWAMGLIPKHLLDDAALAREAQARGLSPAERKTFSIRNSDFSRRPIGTGPYKFTEWRPDQFIRLTRSDSYWDRKPEYAELYFRVIPDYLTMELEFSAGALDMYEALPHQAERYRKDESYRVVSSNEGVFSYIGYNMRRPQFKDVRVRRALGMAVDVSSIIKYVLSGEGKRATGPYYSNTPYNDPEVKPLPFDPDGALALLAEAGWRKNARGMLEKDGQPLSFTVVTNNGNPARKAIMTIAQESWRKLGIDCKIQAFEWTVFIEDFVHKNNFDAVVLGWTGGDINPDKYQLWHSSQTDPYELNYTGFKNARVDQLIEQIRVTYDTEQVVKLARELHRIIAQEQPYTFLYEPLKPVVLDKRIAVIDRTPDGRELVKKVEPTPSGSVMFHFLKWRKLRDVSQFSPQ